MGKKLNSALKAAVWRGESATVRLLLEYGANVDIRDDYGRTPLMVAIEQNNLQTACELLIGGADVNACDDYYGFTPLMLAAKQGNIRSAKILLEYGANANIYDRKLNTALLYAECAKHNETAELLKEHTTE